MEEVIMNYEALNILVFGCVRPFILLYLIHIMSLHMVFSWKIWRKVFYKKKGKETDTGKKLIFLHVCLSRKSLPFTCLFGRKKSEKVADLCRF